MEYVLVRDGLSVQFVVHQGGDVTMCMVGREIGCVWKCDVSLAKAREQWKYFVHQGYHQADSPQPGS
jgi:hypothetical protein